MYIKNLQFIDFRNYKKVNIELNKNTNIFIGDNAQGKTNILEGIYYCSIGKSQRTSRDKELINWNGKEAYLNLYVVKDRLNKKIEIKIFKDGKKGININSIKVNKMSELMGVLNVVMFSPDDLKIVKESPSYRRKFLDIELCKLSKRYYFNLQQYNKVLAQRNIILKDSSENKLKIIDIYDEQLSKYGSEIISLRNKYVKKLENKGKIIHRDITSGKEKLELFYITDVSITDNLKENMLKRLKENRSKDFQRKITSIGPHKDDFEVKINGMNVRNYGSQGQQRTSVLTIKFASFEIIKDLMGEYPVLLLDDVLSELDASRQKYILNSINGIQTFITCTGIGDIKKYLKDQSELFVVQKGRIQKV
ncbi:DNA replication/repair protein RecF [Clostridium fermenticellae]|uniref:DNA replication and repair protein RecF n=1 Tax=Clostridium fermenticellae TaxID=2068654 RepID=A0A386H078_9CLOT|nr:DNA replication/repair protein RecF [Clostridium fermenticellae]AYD39050.1 DNA replication/repair protein RecF [Clostridium fermenticellae]